MTSDLAASLEQRGYAVIPRFFATAHCDAVRALFDDDGCFRKTVVMERVGFGRGVYKYFADPVPAAVAEPRAALYAALAPIANAWSAALRLPERYPPALDEFLAFCHARGQRRPTPLVLRYREGDHNALHQDLYGDIAFPLQATVLLSARQADFTGGEFVLVENRPRRQSLAHIVQLDKGDAVVFPNAVRPVAGQRGVYRTTYRHGVGEVRGGQRFTLGLIFHDAS